MDQTTDHNEPVSVSVAGFYDELSKDYDGMTDWRARLDRERPFISTLVNRWNIRSALDIGTGTGLHAILLAEHGVDVTAIDVSDEMLNKLRSHASSRNLSIQAVRADMRDLGSATLPRTDAALCLGNTIAHVHSVEELLAFGSAVRSLLRHGGLFFLHTLNYARIPTDRETTLNIRNVGGTTITRLYRPAEGLLEFVVAKQPSGADPSETSTLHRPWQLAELLDVLRKIGAGTIQAFGSCDLSPFSASDSRDLFLSIVFP